MTANVLNRKIVAANFGAFLLLVGAAWASPSGNLVLVLTNPFEGEAAGISIIGEAGGALVSGSSLPWANVAYSEDREFSAKLRRAGAWLVINHNLAAGCMRIDT
jgi:hypothetical protein